MPRIAAAAATPPISAINALQFGASGGGVADDYAVLQAALDLLSTYSYGGEFYIPAGRYRITQALSVPSNVRVVGDGIGRTTLMPDGDGVTTIPGTLVSGTTLYAVIGAVGKSQVVIEGITVDNATNRAVANGFELAPASVVAGDFQGTACTDCTIRDCEVLGFGAHEYLIFSLRGQRIKIIDNRVDGGVTSFASPVDQNGVEIYGGYDVLVRGNHIRRTGGYGVIAGSASPVVLNTETVGLVVSGNAIESCGTGVLLFTSSTAGADPQNISDAVVEANAVRDCNDRGVWVYAAYSGTTFEGIKIGGNAVRDCPIGISLDMYANTEKQDIEVFSNAISDASHASLGGLYASKCYGANVHHNTVLRPTYDGLRLASCASSQFNNNRIRSAGHDGIRFDSLTDCEVNRNDVDTTTALGIEGNTSTRVTVDDNRVANVAAASLSILVTTSSSRCTARRNKIYRASAPSASYDIALSGDANVLEDNVYMSSNRSAFATLGTNCNIGEATPSASATTIDVTNTQVVSKTLPQVQQSVGAPIAFRVSFITGGFRITLASAAVGDEVFRWQIRQAGVLS